MEMSRITLIPKGPSIINLENDARPIAITCPVSKVAEFFIDQFFNLHFDEHLDSHQFGCTKGRSTMYLLIKLMHVLFSSSDVSSNIIRVLFVDYTKAFDLIDHNILAKKLADYQFPPHLALWTISFLANRSQYVKVGDYSSGTVLTNAGAPQGTRAGPNVFKVMINDFKCQVPSFKYVDDLSLVSVVTDPCEPELQNAACDLLKWSDSNGMTINRRKTKELLIYFGKRFVSSDIAELRIGDDIIERVESYKILAVLISANLSWSHHVAFIVAKACRRLFFVYQLLRSGVDIKDIISVYCSLIRSVLEYNCPVWHCGLTQAQSADIEAVQKRVMKILFPHLCYDDALSLTGLEKLSTRREAQVRSVFADIKCKTNILNHLLVERPADERIATIRDAYPYVLPIFKTKRALKSLIWYCVSRRW